MANDCCKKPCLVLVSQDDDKFVYRCANCKTLVVVKRDS